MAKISLLVCSRVSGNKNFMLFDLLDSLKKMSSSYDNFEVLVKFDSDDRKVGRVVRKLKDYPFIIKHIIEARGRGYLDLHIFYNRLFSHVDEKSIIIGAVADDFEIIQEGWDEIILSKAKIFPDQIFIIHGRPHPPTTRQNCQEQKFSLDFDIDSLEDLLIIDEAPLWSRKVMDICGGFLNETDCWALLLEYFLWHRCGINRTIFLDQPFSYRKTRDEVDQQFARRWWTDRAWIFNLLRSHSYKSLVEQQAVNIYCNIKMAEMSALPPPLAQKESDFKPTVLTQKEFRRMKLRYRVNKLKMMVFNLLPPSIRPAVKKLYRTLTSASLQ
ncbi:hypothetical protein ACFLW0_00530 [Chloroflexota bacterium]